MYQEEKKKQRSLQNQSVTFKVWTYFLLILYSSFCPAIIKVKEHSLFIIFSYHSLKNV